MFITFDYLCPACGHRESRFVRKDEMDEQYCFEEHVIDDDEATLLTRLPASSRTTFRFADKKLKD